jgi:hypothetical protein
MRVYHDWEFVEDGVTIRPLSVGMISEYGDSLYYEFAEGPWDEAKENPWMAANVIPMTYSQNPDLIYTEGDVADIYLSTLDIKDKVYSFLSRLHNDDPQGLQLWGWYSAYDHVCLAQLFGKMIDLPSFVPMWTNDLKQEFFRLGSPAYPRQDSGLHNALSDAKFIKDKHAWLRRYEEAEMAVRSRGFQIGNG